MTKKSAGFALTALSALLAAASVVVYLYNCRTPYFSTLGVNTFVVSCAVAGVVIQLLALAVARMGQKAWMDVLPVAASAFLTAAAIRFIGIRINEIAFIMTFQKTAANLADMRSAVVGIALALAALLISWVASFFDMVKPADN